MRKFRRRLKYCYYYFLRTMLYRAIRRVITWSLQDFQEYNILYVSKTIIIIIYRFQIVEDSFFLLFLPEAGVSCRGGTNSCSFSNANPSCPLQVIRWIIFLVMLTYRIQNSSVCDILAIRLCAACRYYAGYVRRIIVKAGDLNIATIKIT